MLTKVHLLSALAATAVALALAAIAYVLLAHHTPAPAPIISASAVPSSPIAAVRVSPRRKPSRPATPLAFQPAPPDETTDAPTESAVSADSASPASDSAVRSDQKLARDEEAMAEHWEEDYLKRFNLTDLQRQLGKDALIKFDAAYKALQYASNAINRTWRQKVRDLRAQGATDDQIFTLVQPDFAVYCEKTAALKENFRAALLNLQPILNPDQLKTLNQTISDDKKYEPEIRKKLIEGNFLKAAIQGFK